MPDAHKTASEARREIMKIISEMADLACLQEVLEQRIFERDKTIEDQRGTIELLQRKLIEVSDERHRSASPSPLPAIRVTPDA